MNPDIQINFKVTPAQKETILLRTLENGFDEIPAYLKVVAIKVEPFNVVNKIESMHEASEELGFKVTEAQKMRIDANMKESGSEDMTEYLLNVSLHGVVNAVVEVRSTGNLEAMLKRIQDSKAQ
ncbi:hypothetical protein [Sulfurimonas sp.]|jgi:hypothetical protein|uniref:hypothetical protein n=1 Tax=Sulfurimonas sp. TaxID=2022749 RepID=UPI0025E2F0AD|nr:hypothetical protein [Sulfurimonas sp.]MBT5933777.1 hypothetical protein [Sulfurimonas sp.]